MPLEPAVMPSAPPCLFVIGDSVSLHYGPFLRERVAGSFSYARKEAEPELGGYGPAPAPLPGAGPAPSTPGSLDYPHGPFGENAGDSGMVLAYLAARPPGVESADVVLLNCGLHDLKVSKVDGSHQVQLHTYRDNLVRSVELLAQRDRRLAWCSTTPVEDLSHARHGAELDFIRFEADVVRYNDVASSVMEAAGVRVCDLHTFTLDLVGGGSLADLYCDHVHFTQGVRAAQAAHIGAWLGSNFRAELG